VRSWAKTSMKASTREMSVAALPIVAALTDGIPEVLHFVRAAVVVRGRVGQKKRPAVAVSAGQECGSACCYMLRRRKLNGPCGRVTQNQLAFG
jgi:hypothetical protein